MDESLALLKLLQVLGMFRNVNLFILLNKVDIFQEMIAESPISDLYPEYTGGADCFKACKFFAEKFYKIGSRMSANTHILTSCAVDSQSMKDVAQCIKDVVEPVRPCIQPHWQFRHYSKVCRLVG